MGGLYGTLGMDGPWDIKRILGTVPVESDGSVYFKAPANTALSLQPLNEKGEALQLMRSWLAGMPGENVSCIGCHESQNAAPLNRTILAQKRPPSPISPWHGPVRGFSYVREVQPVLDRYCVNCHDGKPDRPFLKGGEMITDWKTQMPGHWNGGGKFTKSYADLHRFVRRPGIESDRRMLPPLEFTFSSTALGQMLRKGHHGVMLDADSWERLAAWADLNAPFYGTWGEVLPKNKVPETLARANELRRRYVPMGPFPDYEAIPAAEPYDTTPVVPANSAPAAVPIPRVAGWPFDRAHAEAKQQQAAESGLPSTTLDLGNGVVLELRRIPSGSFAMGSATGHPDEQPVSAVAVKPFWMARCEITNRQYRQFDPHHESRTEDRHGYQFGITGYDEDQPEQPVVRVSWKEATAFCEWLSKKTGRPVMLPTEAEWEWACRAGTATPFWYGDLDTDFSRVANLADAMLAQFVGSPYVQDRVAAAAKNPSPYDNWIPQDARFNDGGFVTEAVGKYQANPWGLWDMHGNAAEWTRSDYRPYPYQEADGRNSGVLEVDKVVRGGSWYDRPKCATSSCRLPYAPFQRVYNVGFRVMMEDAAQPKAGATTKHRFLKSGCRSGSIAIVGEDGTIQWEFPFSTNVSDSAVLPNGNIAFSCDSGAKVMTPKREVIWEYKAPVGAEVHACQPLPGGMFLLGESYPDGTSRILEVDGGGRIVKAVSIGGNRGGAHGQFRQIRKTGKGSYLVTFMAQGQAREYDGSGKLLRTFADGRFVAIRLANGNTLIGCGDAHRVIEVDPADKIVWEIAENEIPGNKLGFAAGLQRLPNGNTVICNWPGHGTIKNQPQVFEVTRDKKLVWEVNDPRLKMISSIQILDAPGYETAPGPER